MAWVDGPPADRAAPSAGVAAAWPNAAPTAVRCPCTMRLAEPGLVVSFDQPQRRVAPGQTVALYAARTIRTRSSARESPDDRRPGGRAARPRRIRWPGPRSCASSSPTTTSATTGSTSPEITDAEFDDLVRELRAIEADHPDLVVPGSPDRGGGCGAVDAVRAGRHRVPMMSLDNAFGADELKAWADRLAKQVPADTAFVCELKIDGLAISLTYENGGSSRRPPGVTAERGRT